MNDKTPFLGVYENAAGELIDMISGVVITAADIKVPMSPFYGVFFDKDGNIHSLEEISTGGGSGTTNYNLLTNRPQISGATLAGNQMFATDMRCRVLMAPGTYSLPAGWSNIDNPFSHDLELAENTAAGANRDNTIINVGGTGLRLRAKYVLAHDFTVRNPNSLTAASILLDAGQVAYLYNIILSYEAVRGAGAAGLVYNAAKAAIFNVQFTNCGRGAYAYGGLLQYDNLAGSSGNGVMFRAEGGTIVNGVDLPASMVTNKIFDGDDSGVYINALAGKDDLKQSIDILQAVITHLNLLHNWDFRNPVNQKGISGTFSTDGEHFIDRWILVSGSVTLTSNGLTVNGTIEQRLATPAGTNVFPSVKMHSGTADITYDNASSRVRIVSAGGTVAMAKLETGTFSTIENDPPPMDYDKERAICQVYQTLIGATGHSQSHRAFVSATRITNNEINFTIPSPTTIRANPQINTSIINAHISVYTLAGIEQAGFTFTARNAADSIQISATKTSHGLSNAILGYRNIILDANI